MAVVKEICDRVAIMEQGRVVEEGTTQDLFVCPAEKVTRDFISTADNMDKIFELVEAGNETTRIQPGEKLVLLTYSGNNAGESLISHLSANFQVSANIIFGSIDILKGKTIGKLMVVLHGDAPNLQTAIAYIKERKIHLEVIRE